MRKTTLIVLMLSVGMTACSKKKRTVAAPQVIEQKNEATRTAEEQRAAYDKSQDDVVSKDPWGVQVANLAKKLGDTTYNCNATYIKNLKPDELIMGSPALVTKDGVVTVMDDMCRPLIDDLRQGTKLLSGQHPETTKLARHWSLMADLYSRISRVAINVGASAQRRKLNHKALVSLQNEFVKTVAPNVMEQCKRLQLWTKKNEPIPLPEKRTLSVAESRMEWQNRFKKTATEAAELQSEFMNRAHKLLRGKLYARTRYLKWLGNHWKRRIMLERELLEKTRTSSPEFDRQLQEEGGDYYDSLNNYYLQGYQVALDAIADKSQIDEPKLDLAKKELKRTLKAFQKRARNVKLPKS